MSLPSGIASASPPPTLPPDIPIREPNRVFNYDIDTLTSSHVFRWNNIENQIFEYFIAQYDSSPIGSLPKLTLKEILIQQLGFGIYDGKVTKEGLNVMDLLTRKIEDKVSITRRNRTLRKGMEKDVECRRSKRLMGKQSEIAEVGIPEVGFASGSGSGIAIGSRSKSRVTQNAEQSVLEKGTSKL